MTGRAPGLCHDPDHRPADRPGDGWPEDARRMRAARLTRVRFGGTAPRGRPSHRFALDHGPDPVARAGVAIPPAWVHRWPA